MNAASNDYHFVTHWRIPGASIDEVFEVIADVEALPEWWPSVYLGVEFVDDGVYDLLTKGWLPYTLRWRLSVWEVNAPSRSVIRASGDFNGRGIWTLRQNGPDVEVTFDWKLLAEKPLLRHLSFALKPAFAANHAWAMRQGRISLLREVERRRDNSSDVLAPPPATTWQPWAILGAAATLAVVAAIVLRQDRDPND